MEIMFVILGVGLALVVYAISLFNKLNVQKVRINASHEEIGNQLKRQADLIPGLLESTKGFMKQEKGIFENLTEARKLAVSTKGGDVDQAQKLIEKSLSAIRVVVESNPEIKSDKIVGSLMDELRDTADKIMYARRTLIDTVVDFNTAISTIPGIWIAPMLGFKQEKAMNMSGNREYTNVSESDMKAPKIEL